jgi:hypothetical protein
MLVMVLTSVPRHPVIGDCGGRPVGAADLMVEADS